MNQPHLPLIRQFDFKVKVNYQNGVVGLSVPQFIHQQPKSIYVPETNHKAYISKSTISNSIPSQNNNSTCTLVQCVICQRNFSQVEFHQHIEIHRRKKNNPITTTKIDQQTQYSFQKPIKIRQLNSQQSHNNTKKSDQQNQVSSYQGNSNSFQKNQNYHNLKEASHHLSSQNNQYIHNTNLISSPQNSQRISQIIPQANLQSNQQILQINPNNPQNSRSSYFNPQNSQLIMSISNNSLNQNKVYFNSHKNDISSKHSQLSLKLVDQNKQTNKSNLINSPQNIKQSNLSLSESNSQYSQNYQHPKEYPRNFEVVQSQIFRKKNNCSPSSSNIVLGKGSFNDRFNDNQSISSISAEDISRQSSMRTISPILTHDKQQQNQKHNASNVKIQNISNIYDKSSKRVQDSYLMDQVQKSMHSMPMQQIRSQTSSQSNKTTTLAKTKLPVNYLARQEFISTTKSTTHNPS